MGIIKLRGLQGLQGLSSRLYDEWRDLMYKLGLINRSTPIEDLDALFILQKFINTFGEDKLGIAPTADLQVQYLELFDQLLLLLDLQNLAIEKFSPYTSEVIGTDPAGREHYKIDPTKGVDEATFIKIMHMTPEGLKSLMESDFKTNKELEDQLKELESKESNFLSWARWSPGLLSSKLLEKAHGASEKHNAKVALDEELASIDAMGYSKEEKALKVKEAYDNYNATIEGLKNESYSLDLTQEALDVLKGGQRTYLVGKNKSILDKILAEDLERRRGGLNKLETEELQLLLTLAELDPNAIDLMFLESISREDGFGNALLKTYFGDGRDVDDAVAEFDTELKVRYLAMQRAIEKGLMDPFSALELLINYAKNYISDHQGTADYFSKLWKDIRITVGSKLADNVNGIVGFMKGLNPNTYDAYIDENGTVYSKKQVQIDGEGNPYYKDKEGNVIPLHLTKMSSAQLFAQGKETDSEDVDELLSNKYWTDVETWGTFDVDRLKEYAKTGFSRDKVVYKPGDETDYFYETAKMSAFGLADGILTAAAAVASGGTGVAAKALGTTTKLGKFALGASNFIEKASRVALPVISSAGIANAYGRNTYELNLQNNLGKLHDMAYQHASSLFMDDYNNADNPEFKRNIDAEVRKRYDQLKQEYQNKLRESGATLTSELMEELLAILYQLAADEVTELHVKTNVDLIKSQDNYYEAVNKASDSALKGALVAAVTDFIKYLPVNFAGHRAFLFKTKGSAISQLTKNILKGIQEAKDQLKYQPKIFMQNLGKLAKEFGKFAVKQTWGGAWTNYTDELHTAGGRRINDDMFSSYLSGEFDSEAVNATYSLGDGISSYLDGAFAQTTDPNSVRAGIVGGLGSVFSFAPNAEGLSRLAYDKAARLRWKDNWNTLFRGIPQRTPTTLEELMNAPSKATSKERTDALMALFNTVINNGVVLEYESHKLAEEDIYRKVQLVNKILEDYDNFRDVEDAVALDLATLRATNEEDKKVLDFLKALEVMHELNKINNEDSDNYDSLDALFLKTQAVRNAKLGAEDIAKLASGQFTLEDAERYLTLYYSKNPHITRNEMNDQLAMLEMQENALELQLANQVYDEVSLEVDKLNQERRKRGEDPINSYIANKLIQRKALRSFLRKNVNEIEELLTGRLINDFDEVETPADVFGSRDLINDNILGLNAALKKAEAEEKSNNKERDLIKKQIAEFLQQKFNAPADVDIDNFNAPAEEVAKLTPEDRLLYKDLMSQYISTLSLDKFILETKDNYNRRKAKLEEYLGRDKHPDEYLSADEIISLDPESRATMLNPGNRHYYSTALQAEIDKAVKKLEARMESSMVGKTPTLRMQRDNRTALDKVLDQATLVRHVRANDKAHDAIAENPDAALVKSESMRYAQAMERMYTIAEDNTQGLEKLLRKIREATLRKLGENAEQSKIDALKKTEKRIVRRNLFTLHPGLLSYAIENADRFPLINEYKSDFLDALEWADFTTDIQRSIDSNADLKPEEKKGFKAEIDNIIKFADNKALAIDLIKQALEALNEIEDLGVRAFMTNAYNKLLKDILGVDLQKGTTNETNKEELKNRDKAKQSKEEAIKQSIRKATEIPVITTDDKGTQHIGKYKIETRGNSTEVTYDRKGNKKMRKVPYFESSTLTYEGDEGGQWRLSGDDLRDLGITPELILGSKKSWAASEELYDKVAESMFKDGVSVLSIVFNNNGGMSIQLSETDSTYRLPLEISNPDVASRVFSHLTKGLNPEDFVKLQKKEQQSKEQSKSPQGTNQREELPLEGIMEDNNPDDAEMIELMEDNPDENVTNELVDLVLPGLPDVELVSPDIETQGKQLEGSKPVDVVTLPPNTTDSGNNMPINNAFNMLGNPFYLYDVESLKDSAIRRLKRRIADKQYGLFENVMKWLDTNNVKLQDIIDNELHQILQHTLKIHFLKFKIQNKNEFNDHLISDTCPLCVEYTLEIADIHDSSRGGVFKVGNKEYLMVGIAGFERYNKYGSPNKELGDAYREFLKKRKAEAKIYLDAHPNERAYVNPNIYTEVQYLSSGRLVGQEEADSGRTVRSILELLEGEERDIRNPLNLTLQTLKWMILEGTKALRVNFNGDEIYHTPMDAPSNKGAVFAMIPGCNGHYLPVYINPVTYNELRESDLKQRIDEQLINLLDPDYDVRKSAILKLVKILVLLKEGDKQIFIGDTNNNIITIKNGIFEKKFDLSNTQFTQEEFFKAIRDAKFRINITLSVLLSEAMLELYAEAGALNTDIARLGAANASFSIYQIDDNGRPIKKEVINNNIQGPDVKVNDAKAELKRGQSVSYGGKLYRKRGENWHVIDETTGREEQVTDPIIKDLLELDSYRLKNQLTPAFKRGDKEYYIIDENSSNPVVLERDVNTSDIVKMPALEALKIIDDNRAASLHTAQDNAISAVLPEDNQSSQNAVMTGEMLDVDLGIEDQMTEEDLQNQMMGNWGDEGAPIGDLSNEIDLDSVPPPPPPADIPPIPDVPQAPIQQLQLLQPTQLPKLRVSKESKTQEVKKDGGINSSILSKPSSLTGTHTVRSIVRMKGMFDRVADILQRKGVSEADSHNTKKIIKWCEDRNLPVDNISDIDNWLNMLKNCRK